MRIYLASFYSPDLKKSAQRFFKQASQMGIYDTIKVFSYQDLNEDFKLYVKDLLKKGKKKDMDTGFGKRIFIKWFSQI